MTPKRRPAVRALLGLTAAHATEVTSASTATAQPAHITSAAAATPFDFTW